MQETPSRTRIDAIASFRLRRHHLLNEPATDAVTIARDMYGVQTFLLTLEDAHRFRTNRDVGH
jgi:hypothetical protein